MLDRVTAAGHPSERATTKALMVGVGVRVGVGVIVGIGVKVGVGVGV